jgi:hypothetical protein
MLDATGAKQSVPAVQEAHSGLATLRDAEP